MRILPFIFFLAISASLRAQNFEGQITYHVDFKSFDEKVPDSSLAMVFGNNLEFFTRNGNILILSNGTHLNWSLFNKKFDRFFYKNSDSDTIIAIDIHQNGETILSKSFVKNADTILGYPCDEILFQYADSEERYFYNSSIKINPYSFKNYTLGNFYDYLSLSGSIPLKVITKSAQFKSVKTALKIKPLTMQDKDFLLPENSITKEIN